MWTEDWAFNNGAGISEQGVSLLTHLGAAGVRDYSALSQPSSPNVMYVMAMMPGNTPKAVRRQLFLDLAHGVKAVNWWPLVSFESSGSSCAVDYRPYGDSAGPAQMYSEIRHLMAEVAQFSDVIWEAHAGAHSRVALLYAETTDVWLPTNVQSQYYAGVATGQRAAFTPPTFGFGTHGTAKRALFLLLRHAQLQIDIVTEEDCIDGEIGRYKILFVSEPAVSTTAANAIRRYVQRGGTVYGTAGAGLLDQFNRTNLAMSDLFGVREASQFTGTRGVNNSISFGKMDLPWAEMLDELRLGPHRIPVFGIQSRFNVTRPSNVTVVATFARTGGPAVTSARIARGRAIYVGMLPGLSYFQPALPRIPVDRSQSDHGSNHLIPHTSSVDAAARDHLVVGVSGADRLGGASPVTCNEPLVDAGFRAANKTGGAIVLSNWSGREEIRGLVVTLSAPFTFRAATLASGGRLGVRRRAGSVDFVFRQPFLVGDAIILRR